MMLMCGQREIEEMRKPNGNIEALYWVLLEIFAENDDDHRDDGGQRLMLGQALDGADKRMPQTPISLQKRRIKRSNPYSDNLMCMIFVMLQFNSQDRPDFREV